jgi:hypothetical protein
LQFGSPELDTESLEPTVENAVEDEAEEEMKREREI